MKRAAILGALLALVAVCAGPALAQLTPEEDAAMERALEIMTDDPAEARRLITPMADKGDGEALNFLATLIQHGGPDWEPDPKRAHELREAAVNAGSKAAALNIAIGLMMDSKADHDRAVRLLKLADTEEGLKAVTGYPWGRVYLFGWGAPRDMTRGVASLESFIGRTPDDDPMQVDANFLVGRAYGSGWGVAIDDARSYRHLRKAADGGDERAQWYAAMMLLDGAGVGRDEAEAYELVKRSSEQGYLDALISRAVMLATGQGVEEDDEAAREWYYLAAQERSAHALRGLGMMLVTGEGGPPSPALGVALLQLAAEAGEENAITLLGRLKDDMPPTEDIARARKEWLADHGQPYPVN